MKIYTTAPLEDPRDRLWRIADGASLTHNRTPDPDQWADVVAELKRPTSAGSI
jgi:hypothetical protein